jgi:hypothetical protein
VLQRNGYPSGVEEISPERLLLDSIEIASW